MNINPCMTKKPESTLGEKAKSEKPTLVDTYEKKTIFTTEEEEIRFWGCMRISGQLSETIEREEKA